MRPRRREGGSTAGQLREEPEDGPYGEKGELRAEPPHPPPGAPKRPFPRLKDE